MLENEFEMNFELTDSHSVIYSNVLNLFKHTLDSFKAVASAKTFNKNHSMPLAPIREDNDYQTVS